MLYNTSFNLFGEPLVCTPRDAVRSFYSSGINATLVGRNTRTPIERVPLDDGQRGYQPQAGVCRKTCAPSDDGKRSSAPSQVYR